MERYNNFSESCFTGGVANIFLNMVDLIRLIINMKRLGKKELNVFLVKYLRFLEEIDKNIDKNKKMIYEIDGLPNSSFINGQFTSSVFRNIRLIEKFIGILKNQGNLEEYRRKLNFLLLFLRNTERKLIKRHEKLYPLLYAIEMFQTQNCDEIEIDLEVIALKYRLNKKYKNFCYICGAKVLFKDSFLKYYRVPNIQNLKEFIEIWKSKKGKFMCNICTINDRIHPHFCIECRNRIYFEKALIHALEQSKFTKEHFEELWVSPYIEFFCCSCIHRNSLIK